LAIIALSRLQIAPNRASMHQARRGASRSPNVPFLRLV